jgi:hypothetical protein
VVGRPELTGEATNSVFEGVDSSLKVTLPRHATRELLFEDLSDQRTGLDLTSAGVGTHVGHQPLG